LNDRVKPMQTLRREISRQNRRMTGQGIRRLSKSRDRDRDKSAGRRRGIMRRMMT